jgi:predicted ester cyclase
MPTITTPTAPSADANAATVAAHLERVRQFLAAWDQRPFDRSAIEQFVAADYTDHTRPQSDPALADSAVLLGLSEMIATGFPDGRHEVTLAEPVGPDRVLVYWRFTGTHGGPFFGIPATGRQVDFVGTDLLTIRDGKIVEHRHVEELLKALSQLGVVSQ